MKSEQSMAVMPGTDLFSPPAASCVCQSEIRQNEIRKDMSGPSLADRRVLFDNSMRGFAYALNTPINACSLRINNLC